MVYSAREREREDKQETEPDRLLSADEGWKKGNQKQAVKTDDDGNDRWHEAVDDHSNKSQHIPGMATLFTTAFHNQLSPQRIKPTSHSISTGLGSYLLQNCFKLQNWPQTNTSTLTKTRRRQNEKAK